MYNCIIEWQINKLVHIFGHGVIFLGVFLVTAVRWHGVWEIDNQGCNSKKKQKKNLRVTDRKV